MAEAIQHAIGDILLFVDADLINWNSEFAQQVLNHVLDRKADMVIGVPFRAENGWDKADVIGIQRWLSGERVIWREDILPVVEKIRPTRFGVETLINMHYRTRHQPIRIVKLEGLLHPIKFEKMTRAEAWVNTEAKCVRSCSPLPSTPR